MTNVYFRVQILILVLTLFLPPWVGAWSGKVVHVSDGDTLTVMHERRRERIRLYGVDCPERRQSFGERAFQFTSAAVLQKQVEVHAFDMDQYGNTMAIVRAGSAILNEELIRAGLAWVYSRFCHLGICRKWEGMMLEARSRGRGLWADPSPVPPWRYRRDTRQ